MTSENIVTSENCHKHQGEVSGRPEPSIDGSKSVANERDMQILHGSPANKRETPKLQASVLFEQYAIILKSSNASSKS